MHHEMVLLLLGDAKKILAKYALCDNCLGRQFGGLARGVTNKERGYAIKLVLTLEAHMVLRRGDDKGEAFLKVLASKGGHLPAANVVGGEPGIEPCYLCGGILSKIPEYAREIVKSLEGYNFNNFLIGVKIAGEVAEKEDRLRSEYSIEYGESLKMECSREIGKEVSKLIRKEVEFNRPDIVVTVDLPSMQIHLRSMPLYILGRYRKKVRGIPQSRWDCIHCRGRGCEVCHGTGKIYPISVEEIITGPVLTVTKGITAKFHGAGREDVDAIVTGNGRPFIVEVKEPRNRSLNLDELERTINEGGEGRVEVARLRFSDKKTVRSLKERAKVAEKTYRALVETEKRLNRRLLAKLEKSFNGCLINQYTPTRVLHRRADKLRIKRVYEMLAKMIDDKKMELVVRCQGGLYVKELISGDEGRTKPSVSDLLGCGAQCLELDVTSIGEAME
jgi:tRNA pseudouridine synthase 10